MNKKLREGVAELVVNSLPLRGLSLGQKIEKHPLLLLVFYVVADHVSAVLELTLELSHLAVKKFCLQPLVYARLER